MSCSFHHELKFPYCFDFNFDFVAVLAIGWEWVRLLELVSGSSDDVAAATELVLFDLNFEI